MTCSDESKPSQDAKRPSRPRSMIGWAFRWCLRMLSVVAMVFFLTFLALSFTPIGKWLGEKMVKTSAAEELLQADAIVILGGDTNRAVAAAELYRKGLASRIILFADSVRMLYTLNICGINSTMVEVENLAETTTDHPRTIQTLPGINPLSRLILITNGFHQARVRMIFQKAGYKYFQIYSKDSLWWGFMRERYYIGAVAGIKLMYELLAYGKDWL